MYITCMYVCTCIYIYMYVCIYIHMYIPTFSHETGLSPYSPLNDGNSIILASIFPFCPIVFPLYHDSWLISGNVSIIFS